MRTGCCVAPVSSVLEAVTLRKERMNTHRRHLNGNRNHAGLVIDHGTVEFVANPCGSHPEVPVLSRQRGLSDRGLRRSRRMRPNQRCPSDRTAPTAPRPSGWESPKASCKPLNKAEEPKRGQPLHGGDCQRYAAMKSLWFPDSLVLWDCVVHKSRCTAGTRMSTPSGHDPLSMTTSTTPISFQSTWHLQKSRASQLREKSGSMRPPFQPESEV